MCGENRHKVCHVSFCTELFFVIARLSYRKNNKTKANKMKKGDKDIAT